MKNILITIATIASAFALTYYVLTSLYESERKFPSINNSTTGIVSDNSTVDNETDDSSEPLSSEEEDTTNDNSDLFPEDLDDFIGDSKKWETYFNENIDLSSDFIPLNTNGEEIEKDEFISDLTSGNYAPIKLISGEEMYQLYELDNTYAGQKKVSKAVKRSSDLAYLHYQKEGTQLPSFNFTDINGNTFSSENTKNKILILKCWSINSKLCVEELPELNDLYDRYEAYEDVVFLSLSVDSSDKLRNFLTKKTFRYPVIANQRNYITNKLKITQYPAHLIIDEEGNIEKMVGSVEELINALEKIATGDLSDS